MKKPKGGCGTHGRLALRRSPCSIAMNFTVEEMNLMCIYDTGSRAALLSEVRESLPDVYDPELREIMEAVIVKLEAMTDEDFAAIGFYADNDYEEQEE